MAPTVRAVLCDLDDTLFDHAHASRMAVTELHHTVSGFAGWSVEELDRRHREVLDLMHGEVLAGRLSIVDARVERFRRLLAAASAAAPDAHAAQVGRVYRRAYETAWQPVPGALQLLAAFKQSGLRTAVVTNNVLLEQRMKLRHCGLDAYIDALVTSEEVGVQKPDAGIFRAALDRVGAQPAEAVMLGDAWPTDIEGARAAGLRAVWFNRSGAVTGDPSVSELRSLEPVAEALRVIMYS